MGFLKDKINEARIRGRLRESVDDYEDITTGEGLDKELDPDYVPAQTSAGDGKGSDY